MTEGKLSRPVLIHELSLQQIHELSFQQTPLLRSSQTGTVDVVHKIGLHHLLELAAQQGYRKSELLTQDKQQLKAYLTLLNMHVLARRVKEDNAPRFIELLETNVVVDVLFSLGGGA